MCKFHNVTKQFLQYVFFILLKSLRSSLSEGIRAVDERMSKQEDIRKKKVYWSVTCCTWAHSSAWGFRHFGAHGPITPLDTFAGRECGISPFLIN